MDHVSDLYRALRIATKASAVQIPQNDTAGDGSALSSGSLSDASDGSRSVGSSDSPLRRGSYLQSFTSLLGLGDGAKGDASSADKNERNISSRFFKVVASKEAAARAVNVSRFFSPFPSHRLHVILADNFVLNCARWGVS